jgi:hypothetical protein
MDRRDLERLVKVCVSLNPLSIFSIATEIYSVYSPSGRLIMASGQLARHTIKIDDKEDNPVVLVLFPFRGQPSSTYVSMKLHRFKVSTHIIFYHSIFVFDESPGTYFNRE